MYFGFTCRVSDKMPIMTRLVLARALISPSQNKFGIFGKEEITSTWAGKGFGLVG